MTLDVEGVRRVVVSGMRFVLLFLVSATLLQHPHARAADSEPVDPIDREVSAKIARDPSTSGQIHAFVDAAKRWEGEMARVLGRMRKRLPAEQRAILERSQRDWLAFRESDEELRNSFNTGRRGTLVGLLATEANMLVVRERVQTLRHYSAKIVPAE